MVEEKIENDLNNKEAVVENKETKLENENEAINQEKKVENNENDYFKKMITQIGIVILIQFIFREFMTRRNFSCDKKTPISKIQNENSKINSECLWPQGSNLSLEATILNINELGQYEMISTWKEDGLIFGNFDQSQTRSKKAKIKISDKIREKPDSLYLMVKIKKEEVRDDKKDHDQEQEPTQKTIQEKNQKVLALAMPIIQKTQNPKKLSQLVINNHKSENITSYKWYPEINIQLVSDTPKINKKFREKFPEIEFIDEYYNPILFFNDFWNLKENYKSFSHQDEYIEIQINFKPTTFLRFQFGKQIDLALKKNESFGIDNESFKSMLVNANPWLLLITIILSILHTIFDVLAFKNDIKYWNKRGDQLKGVSIKTLILSLVSQIIILLYLIETETSSLACFTMLLSVVLEAWKITNAFDIKKIQKFPWIQFKNRSTYESETKIYDEMALKYLSWIFIPILIAYTGYCLKTQEVKSWYLFTLQTLVSFVYTFGFIMMTPQLFINYKLKSVAHMPWKSFMYKALNTFIDDLFAFLIKMPTLHRLACLRDDVVFLIYLYQRYIYPVDKKRINEFGQVCESEKTINNLEVEETIDETLKKEN